MSMIQAIRDYIGTYTALDPSAPLWVNYLGSEPTQYSIVPLPGDGVIEAYISGKTLRQYPFAFQSMERTADDVERIADQEFYEALSEWLDSQTEAGVLPTLDPGKKAEAIEALGNGYLIQEGESATGIYQIQCRVIYEQDA